MSLTAQPSFASALRPLSVSRSISRFRLSWLHFWRVGWFVAALLFVGTDLSAELRMRAIFDGRPHTAQHWFLESLTVLHVFPFERHLRRMAITVLRASGHRILIDLGEEK